jgi:hypothetical protein
MTLQVVGDLGGLVEAFARPSAADGTSRPVFGRLKLIWTVGMVGAASCENRTHPCGLALPSAWCHSTCTRVLAVPRVATCTWQHAPDSYCWFGFVNLLRAERGWSMAPIVTNSGGGRGTGFRTLRPERRLWSPPRRFPRRSIAEFPACSGGCRHARSRSSCLPLGSM